jgi:pimeloyl-ACP methyl ester carboxylesterase
VTSHRVIAPDLPGHGASHTFDGAPTVDGVRAWLEELIERTCHTPPVILGHTLGGSIAAHYASSDGARVAALILVDALGLAPFQPKPAFGAALQAFLSAPTGDTLDGLWTECLFDQSSVSRRLGEHWALINSYILERVQAAGGLAAVGALMEQFGLPAIPSTTLARIVTPTTLIWGRQDRATPLAVAEDASARFGWPLHVIEDAADDPTLDQPEAFLSVLRRVLHRG